MISFKNEFSWSISRGGWETGVPKRTRQIFILKQLQNRFMGAGAKVHDCVNHKGTDKFSSLFKVTMTENQRGVSNETH